MSQGAGQKDHIRALPCDPEGPADITVDPAGGAGCHPTLLSAIDAALRRGGTRPLVIRLAPGLHPGPAFVPPGAPPLCLTGRGAVLDAGIDAMMPGAEYLARFGPLFEGLAAPFTTRLSRIAARDRIGTGSTAVLSVARDGCALHGLTIRNSYACDRMEAAPPGARRDAEGRFGRGQHQAVALEVVGARDVTLEDLTLSSYQDTLYLRGARARVGLRRCVIEGDLDFVFGGATAEFADCELRTRAGRIGTSWVLAPSTAMGQPKGFVFRRCRFTSAGHGGGKHWLGRQWFEGVRASPYALEGVRLGDRNTLPDRITRTTLEAVGKCHLIDCTFGPHLDLSAPWDCWGGAPGAARYRPVQTGPADFLRALGRWLEAQGLDYRGIAGSPPWLKIGAART